MPRSIQLFAVLFLGRQLISSVHNALLWDRSVIMLVRSFDFTRGEAEVWVPLLLITRWVVTLVLTWLVCARASRAGKWLIVVLGAPLIVQAVTQGPGMMRGLSSGSANSISWTAQAALYLGAVVCLFVGNSRYWFATRGRSIAAQAAAFD